MNSKEKIKSMIAKSDLNGYRRVLHNTNLEVVYIETHQTFKKMLQADIRKIYI